MLSVENEKLKLINDKINNDLQSLNDQCNIYKGVADQVKQPHAYLITNLQDKDMEIYKLKQDIKNKEQENNKLRSECESYQETINKMKNEMQTLVNNRKKIDDLQTILTNYIKNENKGVNNYNDVENLNSYLNDFNSNMNNSLNNPYSTQQNFYNSNFKNTNGANYSYTVSNGFKPVKAEKDFKYKEETQMIVNTPDWFKKLKNKGK